VEWNALKFCDADGITLRPSQFAEVLDLYHQGVYPRVTADQIPEVRYDSSAFEGHMRAVIAAVDAESIRVRSPRVVVDCCNGAASRVSPEFLRRLGCEVIELHTDPDQLFPRDPEPLRENIGDLCSTVERENADVGFAQDADADRLALVDETGTPLGEDATLALVVRHFLKRNPGPVVANLSTSRMLDDVVRAAGQTLHRSRVGEINVLETMKRVGAQIGGEGNGGVIVRSLNPCRDSFVGMALILESMVQGQQTISQLRGQLSRYHIIKEKVTCRPREAAAFIRLMKHVFRGEEIDLADGIKVNWPDRWLHVRSSNTEPVIRIVAEAGSREVARRLVDSVLEYLRPHQGI
jgi:phosphomannomutase